MYLSELEAEGFRSLSRVSVGLNRDVTVLIGENSGGKSNVIDALRLLTDPVDGRRNLYPDREDLFRGPSRPGRVTLRATYTGTPEDLAAYQHAASPELDRVLYAMHYTPPVAGQTRGQVDWVAGNGADPCDPQPRGRERLRHVYLPPLRDAAGDLGSSAGPRVQAILDSLLNGPEPVRDAAGAVIDQAGLLDFVGSRFGEVEDHPVITAATSRISTRLSALTSGAYEQRAGLGFAATSVQALARALRVRMADAGPGAARDRRVRHGLRQPAVHRDRAGAARRCPRGRPDAAAGRGTRGAPAPAAAGPAARLPARRGRGQPDRAAGRPVARVPPGRDHQPRAVTGRLGRRGRPGHPAAASRRTAAACRRGRHDGRHDLAACSPAAPERHRSGRGR